MKLEVLDTKEVNGKTWALCKGNLLQYLNALKTDLSLIFGFVEN